MEERRIQIIGEINALKSLLNDTDYKALKFSEGAISAADYEETRLNRQAWREKINDLEEELETMVEETPAE